MVQFRFLSSGSRFPLRSAAVARPTFCIRWPSNEKLDKISVAPRDTQARQIMFLCSSEAEKQRKTLFFSFTFQRKQAQFPYNERERMKDNRLHSAAEHEVLNSTRCCDCRIVMGAECKNACVLSFVRTLMSHGMSK